MQKNENNKIKTRTERQNTKPKSVLRKGEEQSEKSGPTSTSGVSGSSSPPAPNFWLRVCNTWQR